MTQPRDLSNYEPLTDEEAQRTVYLGVLLRLRYLRWAPWRKHMTAEDVLKQHGVDLFAREVAEYVLGGETLLLRARRSVLGQTFPVPPPRPED